MSQESNNNNNKNAVDNYLRLMENLEKYHVKTDADREILIHIKKVWDREIIKRPQIFIKYFSDNSKLVEEAKREVAAMLYAMEHPS